jgi:N-acetylglucosamine-6-sulfatase
MVRTTAKRPVRKTGNTRRSASKKKPTKLSNFFLNLHRTHKAVMIGLVITAFAVIGGLLVARSRAATIAVPLTKPNIVYILTDDQTMESVAKMPYVSSRTDWISFDKAYINNGLCCPSRATILSGQFDTHTGVGNNAQGKNLNEAELLPVWMQRAGYQTGMFGKYLNVYPFGRGLYKPAGWNEWQVAYNAGAQWGIYSQYNYKLNNNGKSETHLSTAADYMPTVLNNKMIPWIKAKAAAKQPFFLEFTPSATHGPWTASPARKGMNKTAAVTRTPNFNYVAANQPAYLKSQPMWNAATEDGHRRMEWDAAASVDDVIKNLDDTLKSAGVYDNTIVIFMTDNGYAFGNHRWERKRCEFNECGQTPMLVRYPGLAARHDTSHLVSNVDMASTISELGGATPAIPQDGMSFAKLILGQEVPGWRDSLLLHWPGGDMNGAAGKPDSMPQFWGVLSTTADGGYWKYVEIDTGEKELYNEVTDPYEMTNLANNPAYAAVQADMLAKLSPLKAKAGAAPGTAAATLRTDLPTAGTLGPDLD